MNLEVQNMLLKPLFTITLLHWLSLSVILAFVIDEDKKSYVRFSDDGLYMATLNAFENEWHGTFVKGSKYYSFYSICLITYLNFL